MLLLLRCMVIVSVSVVVVLIRRAVAIWSIEGAVRERMCALIVYVGHSSSTYVICCCLLCLLSLDYLILSILGAN